MYMQIIAATLIASLLAPQSVDQFKNIKLMVNTDNKSETTDAILSLEPDRLVLLSKKGVELKSLRYADIKSAEYSYSKSPRWKSAIGLSVICIVCGLATAFMKGKKHWLTVGGTGDFALIQLDKDNYKMVLPAFEAKSGRQVETVTATTLSDAAPRNVSRSVTALLNSTTTSCWAEP